MTIDHEGPAPTGMTVDEAIAEIGARVQKARTGEMSAIEAISSISELWEALNDHLSSNGSFPHAWLNPTPSPTAADFADNDGGLFALDDPSPVVPPVRYVHITSPERSGGITADYPDLAAIGGVVDLDLGDATSPVPEATAVELTRGTQTKRVAHILDYGEPSRLGRRGQHDLDATDTSVEAINGSTGHLQYDIFTQMFKAGLRGFIDDELEELLGVTHQALSSARREMVLQGYVKELLDDSGKPVRRPTRSGKPARVRVLTDVARRRALMNKEPWFKP